MFVLVMWMGCVWRRKASKARIVHFHKPLKIKLDTDVIVLAQHHTNHHVNAICFVINSI